MSGDFRKNIVDAGNFPDWTMVLGSIIAIMGLVDYFLPFARILVNPGFVFFLVFMAVALSRFESISRAGYSWLMWVCVIWGFFDFFVLMVFVISAGMTRDYLTSIAFRSPSWVIFGSWLIYCGYRIRCSLKGFSGNGNADAAAAFKFSALLMVIFVFLANFTIVSMSLSENQAVSLGPIYAEYMVTEKSGAIHGKLGFFSHIQQIADEETGKKGGFPWIGFWWFPAQLFVLPLTWVLSNRACWKKLAFLFVLGLLALLSIPLQLALQYDLSPFGKNGFIQIGYFVMFFPFLFQLWGFKTAWQSKTAQAEPPGAQQEAMPVAFPAKLSITAIVVAVIWTFSLPVLQRNPIDSMILASKNGQNEKLPALLLNLKSRIKENPVEIALCQAIDERQKDLVAWLLTQKPELNKKPFRSGHPPLWWAIRGSGDIELTRMLLEAGADPNIDLYEGSGFISETPLGLALSLHWRTEGAKYLKLLASFGTNLNQPINKEGVYPVEFFLARTSSEKDIIGFLEEFQKLGGNTLLQGPGNLFSLAVRHRDARVLNFLMELGLTSKKTDRQGNTYLHLRVAATDFGQSFNLNDREKLFIEDVINSKNNKGLTALHLAVEKNHPEMVEKLLGLGADAMLPSDQGETPLEMANFRKSLRLVKIIEDFLATKK